MKRTDEDRDKLCLSLYEGEKSRNFMLHLVRAYANLNKVKKVIEFKEKQKHRCAICDAKLLSIDEALDVVAKNGTAMGEDMVKSVKAKLDGIPEPEHPLAKYYKGQTLALEGDSTDTCVCIECAVAVNRFALTRSLNGDKGINKTLTSMREKDAGIVREPRYVYKNVQAAVSLKDAPGFSKLLTTFKK